MSTSYVSNISTRTQMRLTMQEAQSELLKARTEIVTGTYADIGATLGAQTATVIDITRDSDRLDSLKTNNALAEQRLNASQEALTQMATAADDMMKALTALAGTTGGTTLQTVQQSVDAALGTFTSMANLSFSGEYLFAGINTDVQPLQEYNATSAAKASFDNAFLTYFGFNQASPNTAGIVATGPAPSMDDFITNVIEPMYAGADYLTDWSSATDEVISSRITPTETVVSSASANEKGMRYFALAAVVAKELLGLNLSETTRGQVSTKAIEYTGVANSNLTTVRAELGLSQARVKSANESLQVQIDILKRTFTSKVGVDAEEASTRVSNLTALVEVSYTLTSRIQQLSLVNYL